MTHRDKLAGWQHGIELLVALIGFGGWLYFVRHRLSEPHYQQSKAFETKDEAIRRKVGL